MTEIMQMEAFQLSEESCPFCGARTEKLYLDDELVAERCIQCAYAFWDRE
ncbi:MAG: hypothetical protein ACLFUV_05615 [Methanomassiliicoccales archaeon]